MHSVLQLLLVVLALSYLASSAIAYREYVIARLHLAIGSVLAVISLVV